MGKYRRLQALSLGWCIVCYMQLTVETSAQDQERYAVHMEIVTTAGTSAEGGQSGDDDQHDYPDAEYRPHGPVGG